MPPLKSGTRTIRLLVLVGAGGQDCHTLRTQGPEWTAAWVRVTSSLMRSYGLLAGGRQRCVQPYTLTEEGRRVLVPHLLDMLGNMHASADLLPIFSSLQVGDLSAVPSACARLTAPH